MEITYDEIMDVIDIKYFPSKRTGYTLPPGIYEIGDINKTLDFLLPDFVKVCTTIDDIRLGCNLKINQTLSLTKIFFSIHF